MIIRMDSTAIITSKVIQLEPKEVDTEDASEEPTHFNDRYIKI